MKYSTLSLHSHVELGVVLNLMVIAVVKLVAHNRNISTFCQYIRLRAKYELIAIKYKIDKINKCKCTKQSWKPFVMHLYISPPVHPLNGDVEPDGHDVEQLLSGKW